ncbi:MAG TPA: hypothetical protein VKA15_24085, partial [Isosphaeraceae bacterium]|nr:hypothetical protein [Isosphaeraceae bacterium]
LGLVFVFTTAHLRIDVRFFGTMGKQGPKGALLDPGTIGSWSAHRTMANRSSREIHGGQATVDPSRDQLCGAGGR